ncbi:hypothetical protein ORI89_13005 [Sphingobacterium sp. UT-1RO-CII-1]|uniref:hypothetical protein n=1 Tax=Sphingobacterium sp. UT-1RO-CII-1 TaxID=2995225 RepID=UPI00227A10EF|nr:hypothetical protein [Sphingobacterium sp. UT-1RO-CII-1]MCY4780574.1 hypothetical protein [Sphingobacterium sp. UT-1RO-CII-1]
MGKITLRFLILFTPVFKRMGLDVRQLKLILSVKLTCDDRTVSQLFGSTGHKRKSGKYMSFFAFFMHLVVGLMVMMVALVIPDRLTGFGLGIATYSFLLAVFLINDFSSILFDTKDQYIILPKPVSDSTFMAVRILHMAVKLLNVAFAVSLPLVIYSGFEYGVLALLALVFSLFLACLVALFGVSLFYLLALRWLPLSQIKRAIAYIQIFLSLLILAGYMVVPRLLKIDALQDLTIAEEWWLWVLPSVWPVGWFEMVVGGLNSTTLALLFLSILFPFLAVFFVRFFLAKGFMDKIFAMGQAEVNVNEKKHKSGIWGKRLALALTRKGPEEAAFLHVWYMTGRSQKLKMQLYPTLVYVPLYFVFIFFMRGEEATLAEQYANLMETGRYIVVFYLASISLFGVLQLITRSEVYKAAWMYYVAPIKKDGEVISGALKAVIIKYYLSFMLLFAIVSVFMFGVSVVNDVLLATSLGLILTIVLALFAIRDYPFSLPEKATNNRSLLTGLVAGFMFLLAFLHVQIYKMENLVWGAAIALTLIAWLMFVYLKRENLVNAEQVEE